MDDIYYIDRKSGKKCLEDIYGAKALRWIYGESLLGRFFQSLVTKSSLFSRLYGFCQKLPWSKRKIRPFVERYKIDPQEFLKPISEFKSFNDFFIRELKLSARPIAGSAHQAAIPADGRYLFYPDISAAEGFLVKGQKFELTQFLQNPQLAERYAQGTMVMARLCPTDYHRFHFPCSGVPGISRLINGYLFSVNPIALRQNIHIFSENKRMICELESVDFGKVLLVEVGATNVGTIQQTYKPFQFCQKGDEKGYFSFGGSSLILLFEPQTIILDPDLIKASQEQIEILCHMGQSLGQKTLSV